MQPIIENLSAADESVGSMHGACCKEAGWLRPLALPPDAKEGIAGKQRKTGPLKLKSVKGNADAAAEELVQSDKGILNVSVERGGDWIPASELRQAFIAAVAQRVDLCLDLGKLAHLDASALQVVLAAAEQQRQHGLRLCLENPSLELRRWFEFAGAAGRVEWEGV